MEVKVNFFKVFGIKIGIEIIEVRSDVIMDFVEENGCIFVFYWLICCVFEVIKGDIICYKLFCVDWVYLVKIIYLVVGLIVWVCIIF